MLNNWFVLQDEEFKTFVKDPKVFMRTSLSLKELEELDNRFINNSPEGDNDRVTRAGSEL